MIGLLTETFELVGLQGHQFLLVQPLGAFASGSRGFHRMLLQPVHRPCYMAIAMEWISRQMAVQRTQFEAITYDLIEQDQ